MLKQFDPTTINCKPHRTYVERLFGTLFDPPDPEFRTTTTGPTLSEANLRTMRESILCMSDNFYGIGESQRLAPYHEYYRSDGDLFPMYTTTVGETRHTGNFEIDDMFYYSTLDVSTVRKLHAKAKRSKNR